MKSKVVLGVLAAIGILALPATVAQAGSGGTPFPLTSFFVCHGINNGQAVDGNVDVTGSRLLVDPENVKIGKGILACVVAKLWPAGADKTVSANELDPNPGNTASDGLKCYTVSVSREGIPPVSNTYTITDNLFGVESGVQATRFQYICAPATFNPEP